ncbi:type II secretion system major pseudopilin GspG [Gymnodinialimonas sp.]
MKLISKNRWSERAGVTILEVLVVLTILALIAAVVAPRAIGYLARARSETADLQLRSISQAVQLFYLDMGRYPSDSEGLSVLVSPPATRDGWTGPYINVSDGLLDPWGRSFLYEEGSEGAGFVVRSLGRDGTEGGTGEDTDLEDVSF